MTEKRNLSLVKMRPTYFVLLIIFIVASVLLFTPIVTNTVIGGLSLFVWFITAMAFIFPIVYLILAYKELKEKGEVKL